jgi:hypothetical protein
MPSPIPLCTWGVQEWSDVALPHEHIRSWVIAPASAAMIPSGPKVVRSRYVTSRCVAERMPGSNLWRRCVGIISALTSA